MDFDDGAQSAGEERTCLTIRSGISSRSRSAQKIFRCWRCAPTSTAHTVQDLIDTLKAKPGRLNFGTGTINGAARRAVVCETHRHELRHHPLQGQRRDRAGASDRQRRFRHRRRGVELAAHQGRQIPRARQIERPAAQPIARSAAARRGRGHAGARRYLDLDRASTRRPARRARSSASCRISSPPSTPIRSSPGGSKKPASSPSAAPLRNSTPWFAARRSGGAR